MDCGYRDKLLAFHISNLHKAKFVFHMMTLLSKCVTRSIKKKNKQTLNLIINNISKPLCKYKL